VGGVTGKAEEEDMRRPPREGGKDASEEFLVAAGETGEDAEATGPIADGFGAVCAGERFKLLDEEWPAIICWASFAKAVCDKRGLSFVSELVTDAVMATIIAARATKNKQPSRVERFEKKFILGV
jgi:hypothetical protein